MSDLRAKTAVVTGAAGSMGAATVEALLQEGLQVAMVDIDGDRLSQLAQRLGSRTWPVRTDISDPDAVHGAHERVVEDLGPVDVLVNNAGVLSNHKAETTSPDEWRRVLAVNLDGAFYWSRAVIADMKAQRWGRIVNTCSLAAKSGGLTAGTAYTVSKGALGALTFSLARELATFGITVNGIAPAYVRTPMVTEHLTADQRRELLEQIPVGRFCDPAEFAHAVRFLVSEMSGFITGEILDQNGGLHFD